MTHSCLTRGASVPLTGWTELNPFAFVFFTEWTERRIKEGRLGMGKGEGGDREGGGGEKGEVEVGKGGGGGQPREG